MGLRPERFGEAANRIEFAHDVLQFGAVTDAEDLAEPSSLPHHRILVDEQDPGIGEMKFAANNSGVHRAHRLRQRGPRHRFVFEVEKSTRFVVDEFGTLTLAEHHQSFSDRMQYRFVMAVHGAQLIGRHPQGLPSEASTQKHGSCCSGGESGKYDGEDHG